MAKTPAEGDELAWRERAVSRSLNAARSRAEQRVQRFLDAGFSLIDEKGTTEFTIQEVIERSKQSLRAFYQHFDGKDELLLALFEETVREASEDLESVANTDAPPMERLHAFTVRLHEWCDPSEKPRKRGTHNRRPIMEFSVTLAVEYSDRVKEAMAPISRMMVTLVSEANAAGAIEVDDPRQTAWLVQQLVMHTWFANRLVDTPRARMDPETVWNFCRRGLNATD
jgi:AcrR family transcriptional regulator